MTKLKFNPAILSFLPILIFIPLCIEIFKNIHLGGIDLASEFLKAALFPSFNVDVLITLIYRLNETIFIALSSWAISITFGVLFGLLSSRIFYKILNLPETIGKAIKYFLLFTRSIHESVWGLVLIQIYGLNISIGIISICIPYIAINSKVISEQLENINPKLIESIVQLKANKLSSLLSLIWSPILSVINNFGVYRIECILRSTSILGLFGLGGIGTSIYLSFQELNFNEFWTYLWGLGLLIIAIKVVLKELQKNKFHLKISILITIFLISFSILSSINFFTLLIKPTSILVFSIKNIVISKNNFISFYFFKSIFETIILSISAIAITISLPPICLLIFNDKGGKLFLRILSFLIRLIPPPVTILIFLIFNEPSISIASLALGLYNASITFKLLNKNLNNLDKSEFIALNSLGISNRLSWIYGLYNKQLKNYLIYCAYRSDILIRETAIVGVIGGIGLGWRLQESISSFAWEELVIILIAYSSIAITGEFINTKIKSNFI